MASLISSQVSCTTKKNVHASHKTCFFFYVSDIEGLISGSGSGDYTKGSGSGGEVVTEDEKEGIVDIDENPTHGTDSTGHKTQPKPPGTNVGHTPFIIENDPPRENQGTQVVNESSKRGEESGRGGERKDDRPRGGRGSANISSVSLSLLLLALSIHFELRRLVVSC